MSVLRWCFAVVVLAMAAPATAGAEFPVDPGFPDPAFGTGGVINIDRPCHDQGTVRSAHLASGKILVVAMGIFDGFGEGSCTSAPPGEVDGLMMTRLTADGALDPTFGNGGILVVPGLPSPQEVVASPTDDGFYLVSETIGADYCDGDPITPHCVQGYEWVVHKRAPDGSAAGGYGVGGRAARVVGGQPVGHGLETAGLAPDGDLVITGGAGTDFFDVMGAFGVASRFVAIRFDGAGMPDTDYGTGGRAVLGSCNNDQVLSATVRPDGAVILSGYGGCIDDAVLARIDPNGDPVAGFGTAGVVVVGDVLIYALGVQSTGRIIGFGTKTPGLGLDGLFGYTPAGAADPSFGTDGYLHTREFQIPQLLIQSDDKIVVAGRLPFGLRSLANGALDLDYGDHGEFTFHPRDGSMTTALYQLPGADDRILGVGEQQFGTDGRKASWASRLLGGVPAIPDTTLAGGPAPLTRQDFGEFTFTASKTLSTFECRVDAATFSECLTPYEVTGLADGAHTFAVRSVDALGRPDPTPASHSWVLDRVGPALTITKRPPPTGSSTTAVFEWTASDPSGVTVFCTAPDQPERECTSPLTLTGIAPNSQNGLGLRAVDGAGNTTHELVRWQVGSGGGGGGGASASDIASAYAKVTAKILAATKLKALIKGRVTVPVAAGGPGELQIALVAGEKVVAKATAVAGLTPTAVTLKPTKAGKRKLRKVKKKVSLTVAVAFEAPDDEGSARIPVTVRRKPS